VASVTHINSLLAVLLLLACATRAEGGSSAIETAHNEAVSRKVADDTSLRSSAMRRFRDAIIALSAASPETYSRELTKVLRALADGLEILPTGSEQSASEQLRATASEIDAMSPFSTATTKLAKQALSVATRALTGSHLRPTFSFVTRRRYPNWKMCSVNSMSIGHFESTAGLFKSPYK
jgi:hypothetical protein